jgi:hypothetical protein
VKPLSIEKIDVDKKEVSGEKVRELVENNLSDIQKCIRKKGASGKIVVKLTLDHQTGKPVSVAIERDDTNMKQNCLIERLKQWDFSKLNLTGTVVVSISFRVSA